MQEVIEGPKRDWILFEDDWLCRIGPAHSSHVNFRSTTKFGVDLRPHSLSW